MSLNDLEKEKNFTSSLITALAISDEVPTRDEVRKKAEAFAEIAGYDGELDSVIENAMIAVDTRMGTGVSLVNVEADHDEDWAFNRDDFSTIYSDAYDEHLKSDGWHPTMVQSLSNVSTRLLGHLQDPDSVGDSWDRRGLVIGSVQSGKTANYMGLIAKAADAGYKFIIVSAGISNNLRKQTQERIDEGFVGRSSDPENRVNIGVGLKKDYPHPAMLTNINDDFKKKTADQSGWKLNDFSKPIILVIKKNVHTLNALHKWLKEMNAQGNGRIADVPMMMIDDEADNASVNTNKEDVDPTKTNAWIRKILGLFDKSCYVGYTATPFANIFINPESYDQEVYDELFPRDFIYCLDAPTTYFGPEKVFLDEDRSEFITKPITDCEDYLPFSHKKDDEVADLPPSLYRAIDQFIVARAIRNLRGQKNKHCSMMVNVSRFVNIQKTVRDIISVYEVKLRQAVKANYAMPEGISDQNKYMSALKNAFLCEYSDCEFGWGDVKSALYGVFANLRLFVVNSKSDEPLDYKKYEKDGHGLTAIAVGGLSLSRGLTIEGLCMSYMYRNTKMYDTLMQMGRWFGYRPGFEDLCRVYLSQDSIDWYGHIAGASEELKQQITRMRQDGLSPKQFGLYVMSHPDRLLITARNKMRAGQQVIFKQNFSGRLLESYILPTDSKINEQNEDLIAKYWKDGFGGKELQPTGKGWIIEDIPVETIEEFITKFRPHSTFAERKAAAVSYLQAISGDAPKGDVLLISVQKNEEDTERFRLGTQERSSARKIEGAWRTSKDRVASRNDEKLGLSELQKSEAEKIALPKAPSDFHYRSVRKKPLLMIHILGPVGKDNPADRVPAFGISFPPGFYETEINVVANTVWVERMHGDSFDSPEEEDDEE